MFRRILRCCGSPGGKEEVEQKGVLQLQIGWYSLRVDLSQHRNQLSARKAKEANINGPSCRRICSFAWTPVVPKSRLQNSLVNPKSIITQKKQRY